MSIDEDSESLYCNDGRGMEVKDHEWLDSHFVFEKLVIRVGVRLHFALDKFPLYTRGWTSKGLERLHFKVVLGKSEYHISRSQYNEQEQSMQHGFEASRQCYLVLEYLKQVRGWERAQLFERSLFGIEFFAAIMNLRKVIHYSQ